MPHGILTPLGKQWRLVLANLGRSRPATTRHIVSPALEAQTYHHGQRDEPPTSAAERAEPRRREILIEQGGREWLTRRAAWLDPLRRASQSKETAERAIDDEHVSRQTLAGTTIDKEIFNEPKGFVTGPQFLNIESRTHETDHQRLHRSKRAFAGQTPSSDVTKDERAPGDWEVNESALYHLKNMHVMILRRRGYTEHDIQTWSSIVADRNTARAARRFAATYTTSGVAEAPLLILRYLLTRRGVNACALQSLLDASQHLLNTHRAPTGVRRPITKARDVFTLFVWLVRHAREVFPAALERISELLLHGLAASYAAKGIAQLANMTFLLNKAMLLISHPTAVQPFRDALYQESAIVTILRFMAQQQPQVPLSREGYRAVARVQLTLPKTESERTWAELKALSWPPWKQDRTAMDVYITPERGMSRAGHTLRRMQEAGYRPREWELAAQLYAGWDVDGTPTIQRRAIVRAGSTRHPGRPEVWAARIRCTRTAQEAWAAYLAYEESTIRPHEIVIHSVFEMLCGEEQRKPREELATHHSTSPLSALKRRVVPGDYRELDPPPPSTHLHTYTQKPVPTTLDFYQQLRQRGVKLSYRTLALLVYNSENLQLGLRYLDESALGPAVRRMLTFSADADAWRVPPVVFTAIIRLLCRVKFARIYDADRHDCIALALELLERQRSIYNSAHIARPVWVAVLHGIAQSLMSKRLGHSPALEPQNLFQENGSGLISDAVVLHGHLRRTLVAMQELSLDLDMEGFRYFCMALENTAVAGWQALLTSKPTVIREASGRVKRIASDMHNLVEILSSNAELSRLKDAFRLLIGSSSDPSRWENPPLQPLCSVTDAVLHVYIRTLGWSADYEGILEAIRCIVRYKDVSAKQQVHGSNGEEMIRKIIISTRVFLERSWLDYREQRRVEDSYGVTNEQDDRRTMVLQRLETSAPQELVQEVRELVESVSQWGGWADEEEVQRYIQHGRFERIRVLSQRE